MCFFGGKSANPPPPPPPLPPDPVEQQRLRRKKKEQRQRDLRAKGLSSTVLGNDLIGSRAEGGLDAANNRGKTLLGG